MAKPKKTEVQRLEEDTPAYLRFQESASTSASAFDDKPSPGNDGQDDTPPPSPTPSISTQLPNPQPTPSPSGFLSSVSEPSKPKPISKSLAKALGLDDDSWQKFLLTAELLRQSAGSSVYRLYFLERSDPRLSQVRFSHFPRSAFRYP